MIDITKARLQKLNHATFENKGISVDVLRLDLVDPVISGNKWFKLKYYIQKVHVEKKEGIITFGGAYSNHLIAAAFACKQLSIKCIGIVRGEKPEKYSPTLVLASEAGMDLKFISRGDYTTKHQNYFAEQYPGYLLIPEGGHGKEGVDGAQEILSQIILNNYSAIVCAVGTGTTMAGIINGSLASQQVIGICCLKIQPKDQPDFNKGIAKFTNNDNWEIIYEYHFGGYAKKNGALIDFINRFYTMHNIPTDFVYTAKLFFGTFDRIEKNFFSPGSNLLIIHSGGLQGNQSLPTGTLSF